MTKEKPDLTNYTGEHTQRIATKQHYVVVSNLFSEGTRVEVFPRVGVVSISDEVYGTPDKTDT